MQSRRTRTDAGATRTPDGTLAVCDGGLSTSLSQIASACCVHRISLEHGVLQPLGANDPVGVRLASDSSKRGRARSHGPVIAPRARQDESGSLNGASCSKVGAPAAAVALVAYNTRAANEMKTRLAMSPACRCAR